MSWKTIGIIFVMFIGLVVLMNKFSSKAVSSTTEGKNGKGWVIAVIVVLGCLWYIGK